MKTYLALWIFVTDHKRNTGSEDGDFRYENDNKYCEWNKMYGKLRIIIKDRHSTSQNFYGLELIVPSQPPMKYSPHDDKDVAYTDILVLYYYQYFIWLKVSAVKVGNSLKWAWDTYYDYDLREYPKNRNAICPDPENIRQLEAFSVDETGFSPDASLTAKDFNEQFKPTGTYWRNEMNQNHTARKKFENEQVKREIQPSCIATTSTEAKAIEPFTHFEVNRQTNETTPCSLWKMIKLNTRDDIDPETVDFITLDKFPEPEYFTELIATCPEEAMFKLDVEYSKKCGDKEQSAEFDYGLLRIAAEHVAKGKELTISCKCGRTHNSCHGLCVKNMILGLACRIILEPPQEISVITTGSLPYKEYDFDDFLRTKVKNVCTPSEDIDIIIVGREFNQKILDEQITLRIEQFLFVYSQEMFLSRLAGKDPYDDKGALMKFAEGHPVFEYLDNCFFNWKTTHIVPSQGGTVNGIWIKKGVLDDNGYHVGNAGVERNERHRILTRVFTTKLNNVTSLEYMDEWGTPNSRMRLKKMADSIATFACNAKGRNDADYQQAIDDWEEDLSWLKKTYYDGKFSFDWRSTFVG